MKSFFLLLAGLAFGSASGKGSEAGFLKTRWHSSRKEICRFCYRRCSISCSVGTCGLAYGITVQRFKSTNQCYSCDAASTVGAKNSGDFSLCSPEEAGAGKTYLKPALPSGTLTAGSQPGPAAISAGLASEAARSTVMTAEDAAAKAARAAQEAMGHYAAASSALAANSDDASMAQAHQMAMQIRAQEALKTAQAAHLEWEESLKAYNAEVEKLRKQQLATDVAEEMLAKAEHESEEARAEYTKFSALAAKAARDAAMSGGDTSSAMAAQAQAMELAAAARAAQRRLVVAAKAAHDAGIKLGIASAIPLANSLATQPTLPPCVKSLLQLDQPAESQPCVPLPQLSTQVPPQQFVAQPMMQPVMQPIGGPESMQLPVYAPQMPPPDIQPGKNGLPDQKFLSNELTMNIAARIAENPANAGDPKLYMVPGIVQSGSAQQQLPTGPASPMFGIQPGTLPALPNAAAVGMNMPNTAGGLNVYDYR